MGKYVIRFFVERERDRVGGIGALGLPGASPGGGQTGGGVSRTTAVVADHRGRCLLVGAVVAKLALRLRQTQ